MAAEGLAQQPRRPLVDPAALWSLRRARPALGLWPTISVRSYGGAATVTGRLRTRAATGEVTAESRYLHVYAMRDGRWRLVAAQATVVSRPAKR